MPDLFTLRAAVAADLPYVNTYAYSQGMDNMPNEEGITVAVNADNAPVGFVRVVQSPAGSEPTVAYVNPIVVYAPWQGYGVGRALMESVHARFSEVRLVARGASVPFYRALGYTEAPWDLIDTSVTEDCEICGEEMRALCNPLPMRIVLEDDKAAG